MKRVLLTGATGFIGRNVLPILQKKYNVTAPARSKLNLLDIDSVAAYIKKNNFDAILHLASPTGHNPLDTNLFEYSLKIFTTLINLSPFYGKMIYIGSGAEYGKHRELKQAKEEEFGNELPRETYGLSRYIMSELIKNSKNIINLRLFGCYGPGDQQHKLIPSIIAQLNAKNEILLNQDCWFDFLYVTDIADILMYFIENNAGFSSYNLCSGERIRIVSIAEEICRQIGVNASICCSKNGFNLEYSGSSLRLKSEIPEWIPTNTKAGITNILAKEGMYENRKF